MVEGVESESARGVDNLFVLRSGVRSGLKREFAFALKVQAELNVSPVGRTRSGKVRSSSPFGDVVGICKGDKRSGGVKKRKVGVSKEEEVYTVCLDSEEAINVKESLALEDVLLVDGAEGDSVGNMKVDNQIVELVDKGSCLDTVKSNVCGYGLHRNIPDVEIGGAIGSNRLKGLTMTEPLFSEALACVDRHDGSVKVVSSGIPYCQSDGQMSSSAMEAERLGIHNSQHEEQKIIHILEMTPSMILGDQDNTLFSTTEIECNKIPNNQQKHACKLETAYPAILEDQIDEERPNDVLEVLSTNISNNQLDEEKSVLVSEISNLNILKFQSGEQKPVSSLEVSNAAASAGQDIKQCLVSIPRASFPATTITMECLKPEKPLRRFTRSLLKSVKEESSPSVEPPSMVTSSSNSDSSDVKVELNMDYGASGKSLTTPKHKMELKMSKKITLTKLPVNVRDLLATGLLDGLTVKYIASSKQKAGALYGVIKDGGILCSCSSCKGTNVVSAYKFEVHSGSTKKHPSDYIVLENGKSIRDVLRACASAPLNMLESAIQNAIGSTSSSPTCREFDELYQPSRSGKKLSPMFDSCPIKRLTPNHRTPSSFPKKNIRLTKSSLGPDSSDNVLKIDSSQKKSGYGRVTTKDTWLHKLVFMDDTLPEGTEVAYYARGQRLLEGYIKAGGILCSCCNTVVSPSQFEAHAGWAKRRKPYLNIYTSNGVSLHELSVSLSKGRKFTARENDDLCRMCADGGDLILCDLCPRAFHKECVGLSEPPNGDWYCPCCESMHQRESYVAHNDNAIAAGRVSGVDPIEQIFERCIRIVQSPDNDASSCVLCRCHDFSRSGFGPRTVLLCDQCEKEFHIGCLKEHGIADLRELPEGKWFCCSGCGETHAALQKALLSGSQPLPDLLLENIKRKRMEKGLSNEIETDLRWILLNGKGASPDSRLLLSKVISIFHESFDPIIDIFTGQDLIPAMVYGRELREQDFGGMFCALLTVNSSVVSAGILRILGRDIAEVPLVATAKDGQGLGYFQALFSCIETLLESLDVKNLVLPATKEAEAIWIKRFGFREITLKQLGEYTKGSRPMNFQGTPMLHKALPASVEVCEKVS